jgi:CRP-like cAMP-binding protein
LFLHQLVFPYLRTNDSINPLLQHIRTFHKLSVEAEKAIEASFEQCVFAKNHLLVTEGKSCRHLYFMEKGAARGYYNLDEKQVTHWFAFENDFLTSFHSFITQQPAVENIQLIEGSILWAISKPKLEDLLARFHAIEKLLRLAYEKYYIRLEERYVNGQFKSAGERYDDLFVQSPHIIERVPLGYVASYLGLSQETLSRVRARL